MPEAATPEDLRRVERLIESLTPEKRTELAAIPEVVDQLTKPFRPLPGPQTEAYESEADQLLYGGQAGGGKSFLLLGVAANNHKRSIILRRESVELDGLIGDSEELLSNLGKYNGQNAEWTLESIKGVKGKGSRSLKFGGMKEPHHWRKYAGRQRDFIGFDEAGEFLEGQVSSLMAWLRSAEGNRCRVMFASNPPRSDEGNWLIRWFAPWLDETHELYPAKPGDLLWHYMRAGETVWVDGPGKTKIEDEEYTHESRTFIPASVQDNPYLAEQNYTGRLQNIPDENLRQQLLKGDFTAARPDHEWQVIPTAWVKEAQARWKPDGYKGLKMTAMGVDVAQGGDDNTVLAPRYGAWYAPILERKGSQTPDPPSVAGLVTTHRRDGAVLVVDVGGGYGGGVVSYLKDAGATVAGFDSRKSSGKRTLDNQLAFVNKRAEAYWRFREALDPGQDEGSEVALPPDTALLADLVASRWKHMPRGIQIEAKEDIKKRLGRSPDRADAVVMAWSEGQALAVRKAKMGGKRPQVKLAYAHVKKHGQPRRRSLEHG